MGSSRDLGELMSVPVVLTGDGTLPSPLIFDEIISEELSWEPTPDRYKSTGGGLGAVNSDALISDQRVDKH